LGGDNNLDLISGKKTGSLVEFEKITRDHTLTPFFGYPAT